MRKLDPQVTLGIFVLLLIAGTAVNFVLRKDLTPIFDETPALLSFENEARDKNIETLGGYYRNEWNDIWYNPSQGAPKRPLQYLYRPLQVLTVTFKILSCHIFHNWPAVPVFFNALILSLAAALVFLLGTRLTGDYFSSLGAAAFFLFSLPAITGTWVVLTGEHALVIIVICGLILSYVHYKESYSWKWMVLIVLIGFLGPLYKEYTAVGLFILLAMELTDKKKSWKTIAIVTALIFHAIFPAFLINALFFHNIVFTSTFAEMKVPGKALFFILKFHAINHLFFTIPPLIVLLGLTGAFFSIYKKNQSKLWVAPILLLAYSSLFIPPDNGIQPLGHYLSLFLLIFLSLSVFKINRWLALWFIISWIPHLLIFFGHIHLMYTIPPLSLILLWHIRNMVVIINASWTKSLRYFVISLLGFLLLVALTDQLVNVTAAYRTFKAINTSAVSIAENMGHDMPDNTPAVLVSNTLLGHDVEYYLTRNKQKSLKLNGFTFTDAVVWNQEYAEEDRFKRLIERERGRGPIYLLDIDIYSSSLAQFIDRFNFPVKEVYTYSTDVSYPYVDVLKYLIPAVYQPFPGSPDLIDHFIRSKRLFVGRVSASYKLYRLE